MASVMAGECGGAYCESGFWIDLKIITEYVLKCQVEQEAGS